MHDSYSSFVRPFGLGLLTVVPDPAVVSAKHSTATAIPYSTTTQTNINKQNDTVSDTRSRADRD